MYVERFSGIGGEMNRTKFYPEREQFIHTNKNKNKTKRKLTTISL